MEKYQAAEIIEAQDAAQLQDQLNIFMHQTGYNVVRIIYSILTDKFVATVFYQTV